MCSQQWSAGLAYGGNVPGETARYGRDLTSFLDTLALPIDRLCADDQQVPARTRGVSKMCRPSDDGQRGGARGRHSDHRG